MTQGISRSSVSPGFTGSLALWTYVEPGWSRKSERGGASLVVPPSPQTDEEGFPCRSHRGFIMGLQDQGSCIGGSREPLRLQAFRQFHQELFHGAQRAARQGLRRSPLGKLRLRGAWRQRRRRRRFRSSAGSGVRKANGGNGRREVPTSSEKVAQLSRSSPDSFFLPRFFGPRKKEFRSQGALSLRCDSGFSGRTCFRRTCFHGEEIHTPKELFVARSDRFTRFRTSKVPVHETPPSRTGKHKVGTQRPKKPSLPTSSNCAKSFCLLGSIKPADRSSSARNLA